MTHTHTAYGILESGYKPDERERESNEGRKVVINKDNITEVEDEVDYMIKEIEHIKDVTFEGYGFLQTVALSRPTTRTHTVWRNLLSSNLPRTICSFNIFGTSYI